METRYRERTNISYVPIQGVTSDIYNMVLCWWTSPVAQWWRNLPAKAGDSRDRGSIPESGRSPGVGNDKPTPVFLPGKSHGQRSLAGYSPWGRKEVERWVTLHTFSLLLCRWWSSINIRCPMEVCISYVFKLRLITFKLRAYTLMSAW